MTNDHRRDPDRDDALGAALRGALGEVPEPDWGRLRASIAARAELPLARRRRQGSGFGRWGRVRALVPLAAAAGIAGAALAITTARPSSPPPLSAEEQRMLQQIVEAPFSDADPLLTGETAREALLEAAVGS